MNPHNPNNIKVGDIITSYYAGFFRVTEIKRRFYTKDDELRYKSYTGPGGNIFEGREYESQIFFVQVADKKGKPKKSKVKTCSIGYCQNADQDLDGQIKNLVQIRETLKNL